MLKDDISLSSRPCRNSSLLIFVDNMLFVVPNVFHLNILQNFFDDQLEIKSMECECPRGAFKCSHTTALFIHGIYNLSRTDVECQWRKRKLNTVLCKSNANVFRRNSRLFLAFRRKNIEFSMEGNFQRKVTIIREAYCLQLCEFSNDNSFGTKTEFDFLSAKSLCS